MAKKKQQPEAPETTEAENTTADADQTTNSTAEQPAAATKRELPEIYPYDAMEFKLQNWKSEDGNTVIGYKAKSGDIAMFATAKTLAEATKDLLNQFYQKFSV